MDWLKSRSVKPPSKHSNRQNNAVAPLILIDGEEIIGGDQNRIINSTILIDANSEMAVPVSCTENGRWAYKSEFKQSDYIANYNTRKAKRYAEKTNQHTQDVIWSSINQLEVETASHHLQVQWKKVTKT